MALEFRIVFLLQALVWSSLTTGCYSFKDASVDPNVKTFMVELFVNQAPKTQPGISQQFTEGLKSKILSESGLALRDAQGDVKFQGSIVQYDVKPVAPQAGETSAQNRLTIAVEVIFENNVNPKDNWRKRFSRYVDFDSNLTFSTIEDQLVEQVLDQLFDDIFRKAFVNW